MSLARDKFFWQAFSRHAQHTLDAAKQLVHLLQDASQRERLAANIKELEHYGDEITHDTVQALHQTWITPLDREEIHGLITSLDDVLDVTEATSDRIALYEISDVRPEAVELAQVLEAATEDISNAVSMLFELKDPKRVLAVCKSISERERAADKIFRGALARLFKERGDLLEVIKWRDIFDALESATDRAEDVANVIEGIVLEHG